MDNLVKQSLFRQAIKHQMSLFDRTETDGNKSTYHAKRKKRNRKRNKVARKSRVSNLQRGTYGERRKSKHKTR